MRTDVLVTDVPTASADNRLVRLKPNGVNMLLSSKTEYFGTATPIRSNVNVFNCVLVQDSLRLIPKFLTHRVKHFNEACALGFKNLRKM